MTPAGPTTEAPSAEPTTKPPVGPTTRPPAPTPTTVSTPPTVELTRAGGISGDTRTIVVRPDGSWTNDGARGKLSAAQLTRLRELTDDPHLPVEARRKNPPRAVCNDTYTYTLAVRGLRIRWDQCPSSGDSPEITKAIIDLLNNATRP